jgi:DNA-directed RNA polymerase subunit RPC12/RpoP
MPLPNQNKTLSLPLETLHLSMIRGYSPLIAVVGSETGVGKSMFTARASELIYNRTYGKVWRPKDNDGQNLFFFMQDFKTELFKSQGRIFILDEAEIELGSDDWQTVANRWFSRMKSTQRIKGNLYFVVLPMFMLLARKHRRAVNYIWDIKGRGFGNCYKIVKKSAQLLGDDMSRFYIGSMRLNEPDCKLEYKIMDNENKKRIEHIESDKYDYELFKQSKGLEKFKKFQAEKNGKPTKWTYKCYSCGNTFENKSAIDKVVKCPNCKVMINCNSELLVSKPCD